MGTFFHKLAAKIAAFFAGHASAIQTVIKDAESVIAVASPAIAAMGLPVGPAIGVVLGKISQGLSEVTATVAAESTAGTLTAHVQNLTSVTEELLTVATGATSAVSTHVTAVANKVNAVVGALEAAANSAVVAGPSPAPPA